MFEADRIYFDDDTHTYFDKETGKALISPTRIVKAYSHPFDPDGSILRRCAEREGVTPEKLQAEWRKKGDDSIVKGHSIHDSFEQYIKTGEIHEENADIIFDFIAKVPKEGERFPEVTLYNLEYGIAGRTDLVELWWDNILNVYDFKTNKKINKYAFGKSMLPPLSHLGDSTFQHYECQLSLYAFMLEEQGYCIKNLNLLWVNPKRQIEVMPVRYLRDDTLNLLKHYNENRKD